MKFFTKADTIIWNDCPISRLTLEKGGTLKTPQVPKNNFDCNAHIELVFTALQMPRARVSKTDENPLSPTQRAGFSGGRETKKQ